MWCLSILYRLVCSLLGLTAVLVRGDLSKGADLLVLRHENAVLRRQVSRVRYRPAERVWLTALSRLLPRRRGAGVFAVTAATILAWHRKLISRRWDYTARRQPGALPTAAGITTLVLSHGQRESPLGTPARAGRTGPARPIASPPPP